MRKVKNSDGTFSLCIISEKRFILENKTEKEVDDLKKQFDKIRRDQNKLNRGIR